MTASLYQSGSTIVSPDDCAMRLTLAAQIAPRNQGLKQKRPCCHGRSGELIVDLVRLRRIDPLLARFRGLAGDALPLAAAQHPGVGKVESAIECLAVLAGALLSRPTRNDRYVWTK